MDKRLLEKFLLDGMSTREIEKVVGLNHRTISYWITKHGLKELSQYKKNPNYAFNKIDTKEKAYILGFMLGDSAIGLKHIVEVSVSMMDRCVVEFMAQHICGNVVYDHGFDKKARKFPRARLSKKITDVTTFIGGPQKKDRHFPILKGDLERYAMLGLFDADGCITWGFRKDKNRLWQKISITSSLKILTGVQQYLIKKLDISTIVRPKSNEDCYIIEFSNKADVKKFLNHLYPSEEFIVLKRKYLKAKALRLELEENGEGVI